MLQQVGPKSGTLVDLFKAMENATPGFRTDLLEHLNSERVAALLDRTIAGGRSIGTLGLAMRELGETDSELLARLERAIGAPGFLRVIVANGTLVDLFGVMQRATPRFRTVLLEQITAEQA